MRTSNAGQWKLLMLLLALGLTNCADKMCLGATAIGKCSVCAYGFPDSSGTCVSPTTTISNCYSYSSGNSCSECEWGFYRNLSPSSLNATCTALDSSIRDYCRYSTISPTLCSHCNFGVLSDAGYCFPLNTCSDPNCNSCYFDASGLEQCFECMPDYMLWASVNPGLCLPSSNLTNCLATNSWVSCGRCRVGYYWDNSTCSSTSKTVIKGAHRWSVVSGLLVLLSLWKQ